jgi:DNA repair exonuclease SbcCD ATPase subunit
MIQLTYLSLSGFRSFAEESEISFPENGMVLIKGRKADGGSSGAGKSSLLLAISYALGFNPYPATELQSDIGDREMHVCVGLKEHGVDWSIERGPGYLYVEDGHKNMLRGKPAEEKLKQIFQATPEMLQALTYRQQKTPGRFLSMKDSQKKEFLSDLLNLERFETAAEEAGKEANAIDTEEPLRRQAEYVQQTKKERDQRDSLATDLQVLQSDFVHIEETLKRDEIAYRYQNDRLVEAKKKLDDVLASAPKEPEDLVQLKTLRDQANKKIVELTRSEADRKRRAEQEFYELQRKLAKVEADLSQETVLLRQIEKLESNKGKGSTTCPTCKRSGWEKGFDYDLLIDNEIAEVRRKLAGFADLRNIRDGLEFDAGFGVRFIEDSSLEKLREMVKQAADKIAVREQTWAHERNILVGALNKEKEQAQTYTDNLKQEWMRSQSSYALIKSKIESKSQQILRADSNVNEWAMRAASAKAEHETRKYRQGLLKDFQSLVGREGFLGAIFDEVLAEITDETNRILARIPNTDTVTLRFDSEATTKAGKVNRTIVPVLSVNGNTGKLESRCSGGMYSTVELAVDMAVAEVISRRTNSFPGWMCLDESFDGLDAPSKEACFALLQQQAQKKLILVVDHSESFAEMFSSTITVESKDGKSFVV